MKFQYYTDVNFYEMRPLSHELSGEKAGMGWILSYIFEIAHSIDTTRKLEHFSTLQFSLYQNDTTKPSSTSIFLYTKLKGIIRFYMRKQKMIRPTGQRSFVHCTVKIKVLEMQFYTSHSDRALLF